MPKIPCQAFFSSEKIALLAQLSRQSRRRHCFDSQSKQWKSAAQTDPVVRSRLNVSRVISTRTLLLSAIAISTPLNLISFLVRTDLPAARAIRTIPLAPASMRFRRHDHSASLGCDFKSLFPFEKKTVCRQFVFIEPVPKGAASGRVQFVQMVSVDKMSVHMVFSLRKVHQHSRLTVSDTDRFIPPPPEEPRLCSPLVHERISLQSLYIRLETALNRSRFVCYRVFTNQLRHTAQT